MSEVLGGYLLLELIGRGSSGRVWRARKTEGGSVVAVKVLHEDLADDPEVRERFQAEAEWMAGHRLPGVVSVHEVVFDRGRLALVMDLIEGVDLRRLITERRPLGAGEACTIAAQVANGLASAHAAGAIHRDVKPENVLVSGGEHGPSAWITDFGVARLMGGPSRTRASRIVGTTDYVAPEVLGGQSATGAVDVYALGIVVFEAVTGWRPFRGEHAAAVMQQHLHAPLIKPQEFPDPLWSLVEQCLSRDPTQRPTAAEMTAELTSLAAELEDLPPLPRTAAPPPATIDSPSVVPTEVRGQRRPLGGPEQQETRTRRGPRLRPMLAAAIACLLLVLGVSGAAFALQGRAEDPIVDTAASSDDVGPAATSSAADPGESSAAAQEAAAQQSAQEAAAQQSAQEAAAQQSAQEAAAQQSAAPAAQEPAAPAAQAPTAPAPTAPAPTAPTPTAPTPTPTAPTPTAPTAKPAPEPTYHVFRASENLDGRSTKDINDRDFIDMYIKGDNVRVICQASGGVAYGSKIWDYTAEKVWVPDKYVKTGTDSWAPGVPRCP